MHWQVFDALNDIEQLEVGMKAVIEAGGVLETAMCKCHSEAVSVHLLSSPSGYSGDMLVG